MSFGRLERREAAPPMSDINMTPLIDVMLVLLVIFIIAAPLMASALKLQLPKAEMATPGTASQQVVAISIDAEGRYFLGDEPMEPTELKARLQSLAAQRPDAELRLSADRNVPYGQVAALIDWAQAAHLNRIAFVSDKDNSPR
ncbi:biopolymer transporter ExbD [Roseateles sp. SL47]|uniref:ExbD/TolR family protein n=1 Tax=Roseateles sp. SL47 TaxID=2995138 RepID=UPI00226E1CCC|nr:biopolymer transporter ExbD [Roseateles sp. SL47]WAC74426.1 biopolymer transporter ExbD [Roseateles sp. SL47]